MLPVGPFHHLVHLSASLWSPPPCLQAKLPTKPPPSSPCPTQHEMPSWTTLTPLYEEDVIYALDAPSLAAELGCSSGVKGVTDLLSETEDKVSLMAYLK